MSEGYDHTTVIPVEENDIIKNTSLIEWGCPDPPQPRNARVEMTYVGIIYYAMFVCDEGYEFEGAATVRSTVCLQGNKWSANITGCKGRLISTQMAAIYYVAIGCWCHM